MSAAVPLVGVNLGGSRQLLVKCQSILADMRRAAKHVKRECGPQLVEMLTECEAMLADMRREMENLRAKRTKEPEPEPQPQTSSCECNEEFENGTQFRDYCENCIDQEDE